MSLHGYDKHAYEPFAVTVDLAVFTLRAGRLHILLVERGQEPYAGRWALPGGFLAPDESAESAARRELAVVVLDLAGELTAADLGGVFGWRRNESAAILDDVAVGRDDEAGFRIWTRR